MDLTFVDVFEKYGLDAPIDSFANAFANAGYLLWHANQAARYNILKGIKPPASGNWINGTHADDIDYQIECDYAGLMSPGMPNVASAISDKIGHIMNYGDGWYGGIYLGAMYSLAFTSNDIRYIVKEALKAVPAKSKYYQCMADVIKWQQQYPNDWHQSWYLLQKKWSNDVSCADGIFSPFNIDATINSAYVIMALLYGNGDYTKTLEIATRAGQDADCNPSSAGGILGTMLGYSKIPAYWKQGLSDAEDIDFKYTTISLNKVYDIGFKQALENLKRNGATITASNVSIPNQKIVPVRFEQSYPNIYPIDKIDYRRNLNTAEATFDFTGTGFIVKGDVGYRKENDSTEYTAEVELYIDGIKTEVAKLQNSYIKRRHDELFWKYNLDNKQHNIKIKLLNPDSKFPVKTYYYIILSDKPNK